MEIFKYEGIWYPEVWKYPDVDAERRADNGRMYHWECDCGADYDWICADIEDGYDVSYYKCPKCRKVMRHVEPGCDEGFDTTAWTEEDTPEKLKVFLSANTHDSTFAPCHWPEDIVDEAALKWLAFELEIEALNKRIAELEQTQKN